MTRNIFRVLMTRDYKVFIGNIPFDCRESDIHSFFKGYGRIRQAVLKNNYGFCEFLDYEDAKAAVNDLNGERLLGRWRSLALFSGVCDD